MKYYFISIALITFIGAVIYNDIVVPIKIASRAIEHGNLYKHITSKATAPGRNSEPDKYMLIAEDDTYVYVNIATYINANPSNSDNSYYEAPHDAWLK